jgi:hypothetical protein
MLTFLLAGCSSAPIQSKTEYKKVVILNGISTEVVAYYKGLTVFTNDTYPKLKMPELRSSLDALLLSEFRSRLPQAQVVVDHANGEKLSKLKDQKEIRALKAGVAQQSGADAVVIVTSHKYFPYGYPASMSAENGLWSSSVLGTETAFVESYISAKVWDVKSQKDLGSIWSMPSTGGVEVKVSFPFDGAQFSPQDREAILRSLNKNITRKVSKQLDQSGL